MAQLVTHPVANNVIAMSVATSGTGTPFVLFASQPLNWLEIINNTATTVEYQRNGTGVAIGIQAGQSRRITGITNANQIGVRRTDVSTTPVTVTAEASWL